MPHRGRTAATRAGHALATDLFQLRDNLDNARKERANGLEPSTSSLGMPPAIEISEEIQGLVPLHFPVFPVLCKNSVTYSVTRHCDRMHLPIDMTNNRFGVSNQSFNACAECDVRGFQCHLSIPGTGARTPARK